LQADTRAVITGGERERDRHTQILSDETSRSDDVAPSFRFREILTIGTTGVINIRVMIMMMMSVV